MSGGLCCLVGCLEDVCCVVLHKLLGLRPPVSQLYEYLGSWKMRVLAVTFVAILCPVPVDTLSHGLCATAGRFLKGHPETRWSTGASSCGDGSGLFSLVTLFEINCLLPRLGSGF